MDVDGQVPLLRIASVQGRRLAKTAPAASSGKGREGLLVQACESHHQLTEVKTPADTRDIRTATVSDLFFFFAAELLQRRKGTKKGTKGG